MKLKIKLTTRKIFRYIFIIVILANLVALFFSYSFIKKYVYDTMFMTREELLQQKTSSGEDIDIEDFKKVIEKIETKQKKKNMGDVKNIF